MKTIRLAMAIALMFFSVYANPAYGQDEIFPEEVVQPIIGDPGLDGNILLEENRPVDTPQDTPGVEEPVASPSPDEPVCGGPADDPLNSPEETMENPEQPGDTPEEPDYPYPAIPGEPVEPPVIERTETTPQFIILPDGRETTVPATLFFDENGNIVEMMWEEPEVEEQPDLWEGIQPIPMPEITPPPIGDNPPVLASLEDPSSEVPGAEASPDDDPIEGGAGNDTLNSPADPVENPDQPGGTPEEPVGPPPGSVPEVPDQPENPPEDTNTVNPNDTNNNGIEDIYECPDDPGNTPVTYTMQGTGMTVDENGNETTCTLIMVYDENNEVIEIIWPEPVVEEQPDETPENSGDDPVEGGAGDDTLNFPHDPVENPDQPGETPENGGDDPIEGGPGDDPLNSPEETMENPEQPGDTPEEPDYPYPAIPGEPVEPPVIERTETTPQFIILPDGRETTVPATLFFDENGNIVEMMWEEPEVEEQPDLWEGIQPIPMPEITPPPIGDNPPVLASLEDPSGEVPGAEASPDDDPVEGGAGDDNIGDSGSDPEQDTGIEIPDCDDEDGDGVPDDQESGAPITHLDESGNVVDQHGNTLIWAPLPDDDGNGIPSRDDPDNLADGPRDDNVAGEAGDDNIDGGDTGRGMVPPVEGGCSFIANEEQLPIIDERMIPPDENGSVREILIQNAIRDLAMRLRIGTDEIEVKGVKDNGDGTYTVELLRELQPIHIESYGDGPEAITPQPYGTYTYIVRGSGAIVHEGEAAVERVLYFDGSRDEYIYYEWYTDTVREMKLGCIIQYDKIGRTKAFISYIDVGEGLKLDRIAYNDELGMRKYDDLYDYDGDGRLSTVIRIKDIGSTPPAVEIIATYYYEGPAGLERLTHAELANGMSITYQNDLAQAVWAGDDRHMILQFEYERDNMGNITLTRAVALDGRQYEYKGLGDAVEIVTSYPKYEDLDHDGVWDAPEEYVDLNGNGRWDAAENYTDLNGNGQWDPWIELQMGYYVSGWEYNPYATWVDAHWEGADQYNPYATWVNGYWEGADQYNPYATWVNEYWEGAWEEGTWVDAHWEGADQYNPYATWVDGYWEGAYQYNYTCLEWVPPVYGPEPFEDRNGNGTYDGAEPFTDTNGNGIRDEGEPLIVLPWIGKPTKEYTLNEVNDSYTGLQQGDEIYRPEFDSKYDILAQQARARAEVIASGAVIDGNMAKKGDNMEVVLNAAQS